MKYARGYRIFALTVAFLMMMQSALAAEELTNTNVETGTVVVQHQSTDGTLLASGIQVVDANGAVHEQYGDGSGAVFEGLPPGAATVQASGAAEGHYPPAPEHIVVVSASMATVTLVSEPVPPPPTEVPPPPTAVPTEVPTEVPTQVPTEVPTEIPTEEPTDVPTEEPTEVTEEPTTESTEETEEPTEASTDEPAAEPTVEPTAEGTPTSESRMSTQNEVIIQQTPGSPSVACNPVGDGQSFVALYIPVTNGPLDEAPSVRYYTTDRFGNYDEEPVTYGDMTWNADQEQYEVEIDPYTFAEIDWEYDLHLGAGWQQIAGGGCTYFPPLDLGIGTLAEDAAGNPLEDGAQIPSETPFRDTAEFEGSGVEFASELAGETVTYRLYLNDDGSCSGTPVFEYDVTVNADGTIPPSGLFDPTALGDGIYDWQVSYAGDDENFNPATSPCGWETVVVGQNDTSIATTMMNADTGGVIGQNGSVPLGTTVYDTTQLSAVTEDASGTVTYTLYQGACGEEQTVVSGPHEVSVTNGEVPASPEFMPTEQGVYNWVVEYSGDDWNTPATSECGQETFTVAQAAPSIATAMFEADGTPIGQGAAVERGTEVYDTTTIADFHVPEGGQLGGTITYTLYQGETCEGGEVGSVTLDVAGVVDGALPASNAEGTLFTADAVGTYNWVVTYSGDDFNAEAVSGCGDETFVVEQNQTTVTTQPQLATGEDVFDDIALDAVVSAPADVRDTAELAGNTDDAGGSVTYTLYEGACGNLTEVAVSGPHEVVGGEVPPSDVVEGLEPGQYNWIAVYTGDGDNVGSESPCGEEQFFVAGEGSGGYVHTQVFTDAGAEVPNRDSVPLGTSVIDTAQFYGDIVNDDDTAAIGGSITYTLYQGEGCGTEIESWTYDVTSGAAVPAIPADEAYRLTAAGEYNFQAVFTPDGGEPISSPCGTETLFADPVDLSITTHILDMDNSSAEIEPGSRLVRPANVADDVTFDYGFDEAYMEGLPLPNGTLTYTLYNDANCGGDVVSESTSTVTEGEFDQSETVSLGAEAFGTYNWVVEFTSSDDNYTNPTSPCQSETFYLDAEPSLTTTMNMSVDGNEDVLEDGGIVTVGDLVRDSATLTDYADGASGSVTFTLHQGLDCSGTVMFEETVQVQDPESVGPTGWYEIQLFGDYSWQAVYSGDNADGGYNAPVTSCENETFTAEAADADPTMETVMYRGSDVIPHQSYIFGPATVSDQAIFTNLSSDISGEITYTLYSGSGNDCANLNSVESWTVGVANGIAERSGEYTIDDVPFGGELFSWGVVFTSDDGTITVTSECGEEQFRIYGPNTLHGVNVVCTYNAGDQTMSFDLTANPRPVGDAADVSLEINLTAYNSDLSDADEIPPYQDQWEISFEHEEWRRVEGTATWSTGESATFVVRCNESTLSPELTTTMFQQTDDGDVAIENGVELESGSVVYDTTQMTGGTVIVSGTLTYQLFHGEDCATPVGDPQVFELDETPIGELPASDPVMVHNPGLYNWIVTYAPDPDDEFPANNEAVSPCGSEFFNVNPVDTSVTTLIVTETDSATEAELGEDVYDTAVLSIDADNITLTPTGAVTYYVFEGRGTDVCIGVNLVDFFGPYDLNEDGTLPDSEITRFLETGDYEYKAIYSGDENFNGSASECGSEPLTISEPVLEIEKVAHTETINTGEQIGFTITVTNPGTGIATGVTITDTLPVVDGITWGVAASSDDTCALDEETGVVECGPVDLDGGETLVLQITGSTTGESCGDVQNIASFGSENANEGEDDATVEILCPDVVVEKTAGDDEVSAGDSISFTMTMTNLGPGVAYGAALTDTLPTNAGLAWTIDPANDACTTEDGVLTCDFGTLEADQAASVTITSVTTAETCGVVENDVAVSASNEPENNNDEGNEDNASVTVNCPDVVIEKTTTTPSVNATDTVSFDISISNIGDGTAYDVEVTDALPAGLTWSLTSDVDGCTITTDEDTGQQTLECFFEEMAPETELTLSVTAETTAETCGTYDNIATISADNEPEGNSDNNESESSVTVNCPDIVVEKTTTTGTVNATDDINFAITVTNTGDGDAYDVTLTDELPTNAGLVWTIDPANEACAIDEETGELACDFGTLASGASASVTITSPTTADTCGPVENTAIGASSNESDDNTGNNESTETVTVNCPDVSIIKTATNGTISATDTAEFNIVVTNAGPGTAYDVEVSDTLPTGFTWRFVEDVEGCEILTDGETGQQTLECFFEEMAPNTNAPVTIKVSSGTTFENCGPHENTATVGASNQNEDDESTATISVNCSDVDLQKIADEDVVSAGDQIGFTISMVNNGEGTAYDAVLIDTLPTSEGLSWTIDDGTNADACTIEDGILNCLAGNLAQGDEFSVHITSPTTGETCGVVDNSAQVNFRAGNTETAYASDQVEVLCPDVVIEKTTNTPVVNATDQVSFDIAISNVGEGTAYDVEVSDPLPAGLTWGLTGDTGNCSIVTDEETGAQMLECFFEEMAPNTNAPITVSVTAETSFETCGTYDNVAAISASNEPEGDNDEGNESSATVEVLCADIELTKVADDGSVSAGDEIGFTISMINTGDGVAYDAVLTDTLPANAGLGWAIDPANEACSIDEETGELTCDVGDLGPEATFSVHITSTTTAETCGPVDNTAVFSSGNTPDEDAEASTEVLCPDVVVEKTTSNEVVSATDAIDFTITVTNTGEGDADDVTLTDTLPGGFEWTMNPDVEGCEIVVSEETGERTLDCDFGTMEPQSSNAVTLTAPTTSEQCGIVDNVASASASNEPDGNTENNESSANVTINCPDVVIEKTATTETVNATDPVSFDISIANIGDGTAYNVAVTDTLPAGLTWSLASEVEGCAITTDEETGEQVLECFLEELAPQGEITLSVIADTTFETCGTYENSATVSAGNEPGNAQENNDSDAAVTVLCAGFELTKVADNSTVNAGDEIGFTMTASNGGPGSAYNAVLTDTLPDAAGTEWTIAGGEGAEFCEITEEGVLECDFGTMEPESSWSVRLVSPTTYDTCSDIENTASLSRSNGPSVDATAEITVLCPDPVIEKTADQETVSAGDDIGFTITLTNDGEGTAYGVSLADTLPTAPGTAWSIDGGDGAESCVIEDGVLQCEFGMLDEGESLGVHISSPTTAETCGVVDNTATVSLANAPSEESSDAVTILCSEITLQKTASADEVAAGEDIGFTMTVSNNSDGDAYDATLTDVLPDADGLAWTIDPANDACVIEDGVLECDFGTVASGESVSVSITSPTTDATCGVIENSASVEFSNADPAEASADMTVTCPDATPESATPVPDGTPDPGTTISSLPSTGNGGGSGQAAGMALLGLVVLALITAAAGTVMRREHS